MTGPRRAAFSRVARGVARCALGRADGLAEFDATPQGFMASLAPLIALPLAAALLRLGQRGAGPALASLALALCGVLAPPVISHAVARAFGREAGWLRYATAFNWCQWALVALSIPAAVVAAAVALTLDPGAGPDQIADGVLLALIAYWLWLHWFLARRALDLPRGRAALLVLAVSAGTGALLTLPQTAG